MPSAEKFEAPQGNPLFEVQFRAITESLSGNGILSSGDLEVTSGSGTLEIDVAAGTVYYVATEYSYGGSAPAATLSAGDADDDRWDTVVFDTSTTSVTVREGTPAAAPTPPDIQGDELLLAIVYVPATATDVGDSNILNWRAMFSNEAEEVHYDDSAGIYTVNNVAGALDLLQEASLISSYPLSIATDTEASAYPLANGDLNNSSVTVNAGSGMSTDNASISLGGSATLSVDAITTSEITDGTILDADIDPSTTIARGKLDDERITSGVVTSNTTTNGEEVIMVDTSGAAVTITLATADANEGNFVSVVDVGGASEVNNVTIETEGSETIDGSSSASIASNHSALIVFSDGTNWFTAGGSGAAGGVTVEDDGSAVVSGSAAINFGTDLGVVDDGDGTATVNSDAAGITVLASGTFTHAGGSATSETVTNVTTDQTANLIVEVGVDSDPSFNADYAWDYTWGEAWDDTNGEKDVTIDAAWDTDPGSGNDVVLDYRIYTLGVNVSKTRIQDLVDSPNGHIMSVLLEDTESAEISVPVPDGETLEVYRWGAYLISDGTAPAGLQAQLLDGSDTVQASENTQNTESTSTPVVSHGNTSGSLSVFKLRVDNATGSAFTSDGVGGVFAYVVD